MWRRVGVGTAAVAFLGALAYGGWTGLIRPALTPDPVSVRVVVVEPQPFYYRTLAAGNLVPAREAILRAPFLSEGVYLLVKEGDLVEEGQPVAELRAEDLVRSIQVARVNLQSALVDQAHLLREAEVQPERARQHVAAAQAELEEAQAALSAALSRLDRYSAGARDRAAQAQRAATVAGDRYADLVPALNALTEARRAMEQARAEAAGRPGDPEAAADLARSELEYRDRLESLYESQQHLDRSLQQAQDAVAATRRDLDALNPDEDPDVAEARSRTQRAERALARAQVEAKAASVLPEHLEHAAARVSQAREELDYFEQRWAQRVLLAPMAGVILSLPHRDGDPAQQGMVLAVVANVEGLTARLRIDEADLGWVRPGLEVSVRTAAYPDLAFSGTVQRISPGATAEEGRSLAMFTVEAAIDNLDGRLRPGMNVQGELVALVSEQALSMPLAAIQEEEGMAYAWVIRAGRAARAPVTLGAQSRGRVEVTGGLEPGARVVVGPPGAVAALRDGVAVTALGDGAAVAAEAT